MINIPNFREIFEAWIISKNPTEAQKLMANARLDICKICEYRKETFEGKRWSNICGKCGCPLSKKVFSPLFNPCPIEKWEETDSNYMQKVPKKSKGTII
jgi:hypothetical protein